MAGGQWRISPIALTERQMKFLVSLAFPVVMLLGLSIIENQNISKPK
jgi:hypothetical protein